MLRLIAQGVLSGLRLLGSKSTYHIREMRLLVQVDPDGSRHVPEPNDAIRDFEPSRGTSRHRVEWNIAINLTYQLVNAPILACSYDCS